MCRDVEATLAEKMLAIIKPLFKQSDATCQGFLEQT